MPFLLIAIIIFTPFFSYANAVCYGKEHFDVFDNQKIQIDNHRFKNCKEGDIINVYSLSLDKPIGENRIDYYFKKIDEFALRHNEVDEFCSFDSAIVPLGSTSFVATGGFF